MQRGLRGRAAESSSQSRILNEAHDGVCDRLRVPRLDQETVYAVFDDLAWPPGIRRNHRSAERHRLDDDHAERFRRSGRDNGNVRLSDERKRVRALSQKRNVILESELTRHRNETVPKMALV